MLLFLTKHIITQVCYVLLVLSVTASCHGKNIAVQAKGKMILKSLKCEKQTARPWGICFGIMGSHKQK